MVVGAIPPFRGEVNCLGGCRETDHEARRGATVTTAGRYSSKTSHGAVWLGCKRAVNNSTQRSANTSAAARIKPKAPANILSPKGAAKYGLSADPCSRPRRGPTTTSALAGLPSARLWLA